MNLDRAIHLASRIHLGQLDKAGAPYILHPLRVMMKMPDDDTRIAAVLHDVVEDSDLTLDDLRAESFPERIVAAVDALTRREGEPYAQFIERVKRNDIARVVKIADIRGNLDVSRLNEANLDSAVLERLRRYLSALRVLGDSR